MQDFNPSVTGGIFPVTAPALELEDGSLHPRGPRLPGLTKAAKKDRKYRRAIGGSPLWEESEMGLQWRLQAGI